jgi:hypothetical protein
VIVCPAKPDEENGHGTGFRHEADSEPTTYPL